MYGVVKWFDKRKGYGFIIAAGKEDFFVHYSAINHTGYKELFPGDIVRFESRYTVFGLQAINVRRIITLGV